MSVGRRLGAVLRLSSGLLIILALAWIASAVATGPANHHLLNARAAHTATAQVDGSLVIAGGTGNRGVLKSLEFFDPVSGKSTQGPRLLEARSGHSAIALADGRVLLTGGRNGDNALLASSEIYDASGASLNPGASMGHARANHTSTLLADGRVLIAGGDADSVAEIYDPSTDRFADAGKLVAARSGHSAVRLGDGRVLLVGGHDAAGATAEIFDPKTNAFIAVRGGLKTARVQPALKLISDGKVQVYGGDAEITMEVYNPAGYFSSRGHLLRDSSAFRSIMYSPGQAALIAIPSAKSKHYAEDALGPEAGEFERSGHTATEVAARSTMVVVGGFGTTGAALDTITELGSCSGTVTTDLTDYAPGETVIMSGSGWTPGEQITLNLHRDTNDPPDTVLYATADENGDWINSDYVVQDYDLGLTFVLTATGDSSCVAQTTFTDAVTLKTVSAATQAPNPVISGNSASYAVTVSFNGSGNTGCQASLTTTTGSGQTGLPAGTGALFSPNPVASTGANSPSTLTITTTLGTTPPGTYTFTVHAAAPDSGTQGQGCNASTADGTATLVVAGGAPTTTTLASSLNASTYGQSVTLTATVKAGVNPVTTGTVNFIDGGTCALPTTTLVSGVALNGSGQAAYTSSTLSAGSHPIVACYNGNASFAASNASLTQTVNKAQLTVTADDKTRAYGSANPAFSYTVSGFVNSDTVLTAVTGTASCITTATTSSPATTYPITCTQDTLAATNYTFTFVAGTLTVTKVQLTVTADDKSKTYGAANPTLTYTITGFVNSDTTLTAVTGAASCSTTATTSSPPTTYPITCTPETLAATNYTFTFVAGTLTVSKAQLTVTADDKTRAYGSANPAFTYAISGFVNGDTALTAVTGTPSCATTATTSSPATTYPITCTQDTLAATNYTFIFVAGTLTVSKVQLTVTADDKTRAYGSANPAFTYAISGFVNGENSGVVTGAPSCTTAATTSSPATTYPITCTQDTLAATNYTFTFVAGTLTVTKVQLTVTAENKSRAYGAADPAFTYAITGFVNGENSGVVSGAANCTTTAIVTSGVGPYPINCSQGTLSAANYTFAFVAGTLTITPALLTVTAENKSRAYGAVDPAFTYAITGFVNGENSGVVSGAANCTTTAIVTSGVGPYPINCSQGTLSAANYTFAFVAGTLTITPALLTVTAENKSRAYGAVDPAFTYAITGFVNGENSGVVSGAANCTTTAIVTSGVGPYPINCSQGTLSAANYTFAFVAGTLTITPALLTVTAENKSRAYGAVDPAFTYAITGFVNGENTGVVNGAANCTTTAIATSGVGPYPINCSQGTLSAANYTFAFVAGTLTITPALLTVTAENKSRAYGAVDPAFTYAITGFVNGENSGVVSGAANCTTTAIVTSGVGPYPINCSQGTLSAANYTFAFVAGTLTITPALLTVTADNKSKTYGAPNPPLTYTINGLVNGDMLNVVSGTAICSTVVATSPVGTYAITCIQGSLVATNYTFTFVAGTLAINPAQLTVTAANKSKVYGSPNPTLTYAITGFVNGDMVSVVTGMASCSTVAATSPVGTYAITCSQGSLAATNYTFTFVAGTLTITPAQLTVTAANKSKVYGSPNPTLTYGITGFVNGDMMNVISGTASCSTAAPGSGVGTYPITCAQGSLTAANYTFSFVAGTLTITPAQLTVTATSTSRVFNDPNPVFAYTITGFVNGDLIGVVSGAANCTTTATPASPVGTYSITCTLGSLVAANYTFTFVGGTLTITTRGALVNYIGQQMFVTSGSSSTTAQVTLSASVQDPTGLGLSGAKVDFIDTTSNKVLASGVPVSPVQNQPNFTGTANTIVTLSTGQYGAQSYIILVRMTPGTNYDNSGQTTSDKTATVVVMKPAVTNETTGGGMYAALATAAGAYAGNGHAASFCVGMSYNKSFTNPKGQIIVTVPQADGVLYIKSNSISSMAVSSKNSTIYTKSSVYEVLSNGSTVTIDGGVSLRLDTVDGSPDQVGVTVLSSSGVLYYSNNWIVVNNAWRTGTEALSAGSVTID